MTLLAMSATLPSLQEDARPLVFIPNSQGQAVGWTSVSLPSGVKNDIENYLEMLTRIL